MRQDEFMAALVNAGVTVHRDMQGPVDLFEDRAVVAHSRRISNEDLITELAAAAPVNFSFYMRMGDIIRYAIWKDEVTTHRKWELDHEFVVEAVLAHIAKVHGVALRLDPKDIVVIREQFAQDEYWGGEPSFTGKFVLEITGNNKC